MKKERVLPVADLLVEDSEVKPQVVQHEIDQGPFDKGHVEAVEAPAAKFPGGVEVLAGKEYYSASGVVNNPGGSNTSGGVAIRCIRDAFDTQK